MDALRTELVRVEVLDALSAAREVLAVITFAEPLGRRRLSARSTMAEAHDGAQQRAVWRGGAGAVEFRGAPLRVWVDVWDAQASPRGANAFLGKVDVPLDAARVGVPLLLQRPLLRGGLMRVRLERRLERAEDAARAASAPGR
ncbi:hypothetical protein KFE25_004804 [Diacronema lutheri]|uniref:Uncharacterized protein n=1 Tax=Diacronema lutheri TaxID=2081491 RepID=A0A8J5XB50_DIALT|nr:hypothetical protein KFE25_004804 [Diacronema lutheri]